MAEVKVRASRRGPASPRRDEVIIEELDGAKRAAGHKSSAERPSCSFAFCPICMAFTAMGEARPELVDHLLVASREMLLALRALIDARLEGAARPPPSKLERLTIE